MKARIKHFLYRFLFRIFSLLPIKQNKVAFLDADLFTYSVNTRKVFQEIVQDESLDIVVFCRPDRNYQNVRYVRYLSIRYFLEVCTARVWISDSRQQEYMKKRDGQFYVMTWHGGFPLKYIEKDAEDTLPESYIRCAINDSKNADLMVAESRHVYRIMKRAFWYDGEILCKQFSAGENKTPEECRQIVAKHYGIEHKKIILYVPTFRKDGNIECYDIDFHKVVDALKERNGDDYVFIMRLHGNVGGKADQFLYDEYLKNGTGYPSLYELESAADMIITDFSGCVFEGYYLNKPVALYASDFEEYLAHDRGMYFDYQNMPSPLAKNSDDLIDVIANYDRERYEAGRKQIIETIGYFPPDAAKDVADRIRIETSVKT